MEQKFPRTQVGGISLPRLIIGCNWISGFSHKSVAADKEILDRHSDPNSTAEIFETFLNYDINAVLGCFGIDHNLNKAVDIAQEKTGKKMIIIDEPILPVDDNASARREAERMIKDCAKRGATFCFPMHNCVEELVNKNTRTINRLPDYLSMIRDAGMIPGLSAHMPEVVQYADLNEYDVETYIQLFNCVGFLMQVEIESVARVIHNARKPVITIKPCAAGRITPYVGLTFNWNAIREQDMIAIGCMNAREAAEDIEISFAAFEHRVPDLQSRTSPGLTSVISGKIESKK